MRWKPKVFACSDEEWVVAYSARSALKFYLSETGVDFRFDMDGKMPVEVCDSEMERLKFVEEGEDWDGPHKSFKEKLAEIVKDKETIPNWFAVTDY